LHSSRFVYCDTLTPRELGKMYFARGGSLEDCPYDNPQEAEAFQNGWRKERDRKKTGQWFI